MHRSSVVFPQPLGPRTVRNSLSSTVRLTSSSALTPALPRLRQRLVRTPFGCGGPVWVDDPDFAVGHHIEELRLLAVPFGIGLGLTLDESALLLELDDVYWTREGLLSVQITLAVIAMLGALALGLRFLRRGEELVLEPSRRAQ